MTPEDPKNVIRSVLTKIQHDLGPVDLMQKVKSFGKGIACLFSLIFLIAASFELTQVRDVSSWPPQPAEVVRVSLLQSSSRPFHTSWEFVVKLNETGEQVVIRDVRPGDLPTMILWWSSTDADAANYSAGQAITVFRSPEAGKVFLERGNYLFMSSVLLACLVFWIWVLYGVWQKPRT